MDTVLVYVKKMVYHQVVINIIESARETDSSELLATTLRP